MHLPHLVGELQAVVIGVAVVVQLQNVVVVREPSSKRLPAGITSTGADRTSIEIAPVDQIAPGCAYISDAECHLVGQFLLNRQVIGVIHGCLKIAQHLHHTRRLSRSGVRSKDVDSRRYAYKGLT